MRCKGKTFDGKQCSRQAVKGSQFCWQHKKGRQSSPKKSPRSSTKNKLYNEQQRKFCSCVKSVKEKQHTTPKKTPQTRTKKKKKKEQQRKFCSCVKSVKEKQPNVNPWAICTHS